jgi:hypothetical protein
MPTTFKVLGQTAATAASATTVVNLITDPTLEGLGDSSQSNISANQLVALTNLTGLTGWRGTSESSTNLFSTGISVFGTGATLAAQAGANSIYVTNNGGSTSQVGFTTGTATNKTTIAFGGTGSFNTTEAASLIPVSASTTYYYGAWYGTNDTGVTVTYHVKWYTSTGTYISGNSFNTNLTANTWVKGTGSATSPSTAVRAAIFVYSNITASKRFGMDTVWFSTDSATNTTFPTPSTDTANVTLTAPFNKRGENVWSGTANSSTTITTFAGALTDLYTVPSSTQTVVSTITAANLTTSATSCRISVLPSGQTAAAKNFIVFDGTLPANTTEAYTLGITLAAGDKIQVASDVANVSFSAFGSEIA